MTINNAGCEFNAATASDKQFKFASDTDTVNNTINIITHKKLLSSWAIWIQHEEVYDLPPKTKPRIGAIELKPQTLMLYVVQRIVIGAASNNTGTNRNLQRISRTGVNGNTPFHSGISETSTPDSIDNSGTRVKRINRTFTQYPSGISRTSADQPACGLWSPRIGNIWQSTSPNLRKYDELNAAIDGKFSNNPIAPTILTQVLSDKLSDSSSRDIYARYGVHLATDPVNTVAPQSVYHGLSDVYALNKGSVILISATIIIRSPDVTYWRAVDHDERQSEVFGDAVENNQTIVNKTIKLILKFGWKVLNFNLSVKILKDVNHLWTQLLSVRKYQTQKIQQQTLQHVIEKCEKSTYQRTWSQNQIIQAYCRANLIFLTAAIIKVKDVIKIRRTENSRNRIPSNYAQN